MSSYSSTFTAASKAAAKTQASAEFDKAVAEYPDLAQGKSAAMSNASQAIDLLTDDPMKDVRVSMNGFLAGAVVDGAFTTVTQVGITTNAGLVNRNAEGNGTPS